jgi:hypothetical protein
MLRFKIGVHEFFHHQHKIPDRWNHCAVNWNYGTLAGLEGRPQALMTMSPKLKTILMLRPLKQALILIAGTQVMLEKAY